MLGMKDSMEYAPPRPASIQSQVYRLFWEPLLMIRVIGQTLYNFNRLEKMVTKFETNFEFHFSRWKPIDTDRRQPHELMNLYRDMEESLLLKWKTPTINDFFVMIYYGLLKRLCLDWCKDEEGTLQNDLICGEGDIVSTAPARMAIEIAGKISENSDWRSLFENSSPAELARRVPNDKDLMPIWEAVQDYMNLYGYRRINELKLEEPTLMENPEFFYQTLKNYLKMDPARLDSDAMKEHERRVRSQAEAKVFSILGKNMKALVFRRVLKNARSGVKNRENLRLYRTRIYGLLREVFLAMGKHLEQEGILRDHQDIFYLTLDELWDFVNGTAVTIDLQSLADLRKEEFKRWRSEINETPDDRFETYGMACFKNNYRNPSPVIKHEEGLQGIGCCPGQVTARVRVLQSPGDDVALNGEILVTRSTDPGWVPLFPTVSGILIEHGSILSHSVIVAREMGIPIIVGITGLLDEIRDGQIVKIDGSAGTITIASS
ncbi:MAG: PEP-utilizing enzyme [Gammaproteobacteria bacterium]